MRRKLLKSEVRVLSGRVVAEVLADHLACIRLLPPLKESAAFLLHFGIGFVINIRFAQLRSYLI